MRAAALAAAGLLLAACTTVVNPVTGQRELTTMTPERERALGEQAAKQVASEMGLVDDPKLAAYVDAIGQRLARLSPRQDVTYQFAVADMPEPNAFALPGGWIYVSRGLLVLTNSEAELANVIGHEIGHVAARHAAQRETRATGVGALTAIGSLAAAVLGGGTAGQAVSQLGQVAGAGYIASYGRDQERQSDEIGQQLAARAGWDPGGMAAFLDTLDQDTVRELGGTRNPSFLDSHPVTAERVRDTAARARTLTLEPAPAIAGTRAAFLARIEGVLVGPDPAEGVFRDALFLHPGLDFALTFPPGWQTVNQKTAVGARAPEGDGAIVLEVQGPSGDPRAAAQAFAQQNPLEVLDTETARIGGYEAFRVLAVAQGQQGRMILDLTWIRHPAATFRLTGFAPEARFGRHRQALARTATSFRPLRAGDRSAITERRLRIATARAGETLSALSRRTGNVWSVEETAVANSLAANERLAAGTAVKIAVETPYRGTR